MIKRLARYVNPLTTGHILLFELELELDIFLFILVFYFGKKKKKNVKIDILTPILSSKYFFLIRGSQSFPCQRPPKLHVFVHRPPSGKISFQGRPEIGISVTKVPTEKYIF